VKTNGLWDEGTVLGAVRLVLDKHLGKPPESIVVGGKRMTPKEFAEQELRLPLDEYVSFQSCLSAPFHQKAEFKVPDNWWHSREYTNLPLGEWDQALRDAIRRGYSVAIGGDVSEPGKDRDTGLAVVPDFDLPAWAVDQSARELRIYNKTTEDDHGVHIIGSARAGGHDWFLVKDSGASGHEGPFKGYMFFRDDFVRLKMLTFTVHRNAVKEVLRKCESR
jgi:bleomycin hydrolase